MSDSAIEAALKRMVARPEESSPPPDEARCFVCLESTDDDEEKPFLPLGCGCRGTAGWAHPTCIFGIVKDTAAGDVTKCRTCHTSYTGPMATHLADKYWRRHRSKPDSDPQHLYARDLLGRVLATAGGPLVVRVLRQNLKTHRRLYGRDDQRVRFASSELGKALLASGDHAQAEALLKPFVREPLTANDWTRGWDGLTYGVYADLLCDVGRFAEAERLVRGAVAALDSPPSPDEDQDGWLARNRKIHGAYAKLILVTTLAAQRPGDVEALRILKKLLADLRRTYGKDHPLTAQVHDHLRLTLHELREQQNAVHDEEQQRVVAQ